MNLKHLYYFKKLADYEHFGQASKELEISQPSLSYAMTNLENELGIPLFKKKGRNIILTTQGRIFRLYVDQAIQILEDGITTIRDNDSVNDESALIMVYDNLISEPAVKSAVQYLESKNPGQDVVAVPVPKFEAEKFLSKGYANFVLNLQNNEEVLRSKNEVLPYKADSNKVIMSFRTDTRGILQNMGNSLPRL